MDNFEVASTENDPFMDRFNWDKTCDICYHFINEHTYNLSFDSKAKIFYGCNHSYGKFTCGCETFISDA